MADQLAPIAPAEGRNARRDSDAGSATSHASKSSRGSQITRETHGSNKSGRSKGSRRSHTGREAAEVPMKKYGKIPFRDPIKRGAIGDIPHSRRNEKVSEFVQREVFDSAPSTHGMAPTEESKKLADFAISLHDTLLDDKLKQQGFDRFEASYDPAGDLMVSKSFATVSAEERRSAADKGPSISKERFGTKSWAVWRSDVMVLEKASAQDINKSAPPPSNFDKLLQHKKKITKLVQAAQPSLLQGVSFAAPKSDAPLYFDIHMQGNRNSPTKIFEHSLQQAVPKSLKQPSLLRKAEIDPNAFGKGISGGVVAQGPSRGVQPTSATANIDMPAVDQIRGEPQQLSFTTARRHTKVIPAIVSGDGAKEVVYDSPGKMPGNKFGEEARTGGVPDTRRSYPGPGTYEVPGIFDGHKKPDYEAIIRKIERDEGVDFRQIPSEDLAKIGGFGFGCNRQEHVLYGFCLDGQCSKRVEFERAFLQTNNHKRLGADSLDQCLAVLPGSEKLVKKKKTLSTEKEAAAVAAEEEKRPADLDIMQIDAEAAMRRLQAKYDAPERVATDKREFILSLVDDPVDYMYPLHMAATRCDLPAIRKMVVLGLDINFIQGERDETPLHMAVRNQHLQAAQELLGGFGGIINVDAQNSEGDTPVHIASRKGFKELVETLCDAGANPYLKNSSGFTPLMQASTFTIQQLLRLQQDMQDMRAELEDVSTRLHEETKRAARGVAKHGMALDCYFKEEAEREAGGAGAGASAMKGGEGDISVADMTQFPWRSEIASRGGGTAPNSRVSTTHSTRSRLLEVTKDSYDPAVDGSKTNTSLFRVARSKTLLKDPRKNSFVLGYWQDDHEG